MREQGVLPVRMIWRGGKRHAFLLFDSRDKAEHALSTLEGMEIDGKEVKVRTIFFILMACDMSTLVWCSVQCLPVPLCASGRDGQRENRQK